MANQEHLDKLREGVGAWNHWRRDHPHITPDLSGAELTGANLQDASLLRADLTEASFDGADLRHANLAEANLAGTSFDEAITDGCLGCL